MRSDIDQLMEARNLDALIVMGDSDGNTIMNYLTGGMHLEGALITKRRNGPFTLIHGSMERDTAAEAAQESGMQLIDRDALYNRYTLVAKHDGDRLAAQIDYLSQVIEDHKLQGRIGVYGSADSGESFVLLSELQKVLTESATESGQKSNLVGEYGDSLFTIARETKDSAELEELKEVGRQTCQVVADVQAFVQRHGVEDEVVIKEDGRALTIADVKSFMNERLSQKGLTDHGATIFALGRESAVPHNRGGDETPLRLGHTIIFDIFPQNANGYYHDMTRTWCLGYAPDDVQAAWDQTKEIFDQVMANFKVGTSCRELQEMTCDYYASKGHPTVKDSPGTQEGYVHGLGHGIGLDIHEGPRLTHQPSYDVKLQPGHVITVEPGLYYPEKGFGIRIEDAVAIDEDGELIWLTDYPYDLVIPMGG